MVTRKSSYWLRYLLLILGCILFIYPVFYAIGVGFMTKNQFATTPPTLIPILPPLSFDNYKFLLLINTQTDPYVTHYYSNSVIRTAWYILWTVLTSFVAGYVFARLRFRGKNALFLALLITTMLPQVVTMAPSYLMMARFPFLGGNNGLGQGGHGFLDSYSVLLLLNLVNVLGIFLVRMSMNTFPKALEDSARMDGAGIFRIMFQVVFPIQKPILAYIAIITGVAVWNDWYTPFIYTNKPTYQTLASAVSKLTSVAVGQYGIPDWPNIITLGLALTLPSLVMFAFFQRYIVQGLAAAAVKG
jgi:multiple sugar transport system permease protein